MFGAATPPGALVCVKSCVLEFVYPATMGGGVSRERTVSAASWDAVLWEVQMRAAEAKDEARLRSYDRRVFDKPLPRGWVIVHSKVYRTHFFYNRETKTSSWTRPEECAVASATGVAKEAIGLDANEHFGEDHSLEKPAACTLQTRRLQPVCADLKRTANMRVKISAFKKRGVLPAVHAVLLRKAAAEQGPLMTALLAGIAHEFDGKLVGLEFKLKSFESLKQKLERDVREANMKLLEDIEQRRVGENSASSFDTVTDNCNLSSFDATLLDMSLSEVRRLESKNEHESDRKIAAAKAEAEELALESDAEKELAVNIEMIAWTVSDVLRYTIIFETAHYTNGVRETRLRLHDNNITQAKQKNYWGPGDAYQGINDVFSVPCDESPTGRLLVEVQFHTPESFAHKMQAHKDYEMFRQTMDPELKKSLWRESCAAADRLPVPLGVIKLPAIGTQPAPITTNLYVALVLERAMKIQNAAVHILNDVTDRVKLTLSIIEKAPKAKTHLGGQNSLIRTLMMKKPLTGLDQWSKLLELAPDTIVATEPISMKKCLTSPSEVEMRINHELRLLQRIREASGRCEKTWVREDSENTPDVEDDHDLKIAFLAIKDALILNVVIAEDQYAFTVALMLEQLSLKANTATGNEGFDLVKVENDWESSLVFTGKGVTGGFGVRCEATVAGEDDGVAFTPDDAYPFSIQFHTPQSFMGVLSLKSAWSQHRSSNTASQRKEAKISARRITARVNVPRGAKTLSGFKDLKALRAANAGSARKEDLVVDDSVPDYGKSVTLESSEISEIPTMEIPFILRF